MNVDDTNTRCQGGPLKIGIIVGSTRPGRRADRVAAWVQKIAASQSGITARALDLAGFELPLLDEPVPAAVGDYQQPHTLAWSKAVAGFDGFVFVVPEYNHAYPAALKNAIDFLYREWHDKAAGLVTYGITGGIRAGEQLRLVLAEVKVATVRTHLALNLGIDFAETGECTPSETQKALLERMFDELSAWGSALRGVRETS